MIMIKSSILYLSILSVLAIPSQLFAEVYGVICKDGSQHAPGFDCEAYIRDKTRKNAGTDDRREPGLRAVERRD